MRFRTEPVPSRTLESPRTTCQSGAMTASNPPPTRAGGFIIAAGIMIGAIGGGLLGQPTIGLLAGGGLGVAISLAMWLIDRR